MLLTQEPTFFVFMVVTQEPTIRKFHMVVTQEPTMLLHMYYMLLHMYFTCCYSCISNPGNIPY
jgi:hypothetical protein